MGAPAGSCRIPAIRSISRVERAPKLVRVRAPARPTASQGPYPQKYPAVGTGNSLKETTRAVAGVYNTMGKSIKDTANQAETFQKIADGLAFTYATQDVQLSELIASYEKFAPFVSGLDDSFIDIITTLGFLNTRLLRSGRAGRLTGRAIIQLSKNASKLAEAFSITFDPDKPVNFVKTMKEIHNALRTSTKLSEGQSKALQEIFATRGQAPIRLLLESFSEWEEALGLAGTSAEGFAQKMEKIRMGTISAQGERLTSILAVLGNEFITGATGTGSFAESVKLLADGLLGLRDSFKLAGNAMGWYFYNLAQGSLAVESVSKKIPSLMEALNPATFMSNFSKMLNPKGMKELWANLFGDESVIQDMMNQGLGYISYDDYVAKQEESLKVAEAEQGIRDRAVESEKIQNQNTTESLTKAKRLKTEVENQVKLLKLAGVHEKEIIQFKLKQLDIIGQHMTGEDEVAERIKLQNQLIIEQAKYKQELVNTLQTSSISLLKTAGASESQMLEIQIQMLYAKRAQIGEEQFLLDLTKKRWQQQQVLLQEKQKEMQVATSLLLKYKSADEFERTRLRRLMELRQLDDGQLAKRFKEDMFDQRLIEEYFSYFSKSGQEAVGKVLQKMYPDLDAMTVPGIDQTPADQLRDLLNPETANPFWDNWDRRARTSIEDFSREWSKTLAREGGLGMLGIKTPKLAMQQNVDMKTIIENLSINLPLNALDNIARESARQLEERLLNNEELQRKFMKKIRNTK